MPQDAKALGPKVELPTRNGQRVSFIVDGVIEDYDAETGIYTIRGNSRGSQHIEWAIEAHWATEFYEWDGTKHG
jgi:hypothetical protein